MAACTLILSISLAFNGCGPRITNQNLQVVESQRQSLETTGKGISPKEVESILGQPTRTENARLALETQKKEVDVVRYFYKQDGEEIALHFVDGKLISPVQMLGEIASATGETKPAKMSTPSTPRK
jgi:hypothetical protein